MLERTAASLESCNLQRVLPKASRPYKRGRRLHTGFWQHGASAIELFNIWPLPPPAAAATAAEAAGGDAGPARTSLIASAFLLDFLYPNGTYALLRRLYPSMPRPQDGRKAVGSSRRQNFTSSTFAVSSEPQAPAAGTEAPQTLPSHSHASSALDEGALQQAGTSHGMAGYVPDAEAPRRTASTSETQESASQETDTTSTPQFELGSKPQTLEELLSRPGEERFHDVWDLYSRQDDDQRQTLRHPVIIYLSRSTNIVEIGRVLSLFHQLPVDSWDNELQAAGVLALMRSGDVNLAIERFEAGSALKGLSGGIEYLISYLLENRQWPMLLKVWLDYFKAGTAEKGIKLRQLERVPDLWKPYLALERYIEIESSGKLRSINLHAKTRLGLSTLRRHLAEAALQPPCPPKQAAAILNIWADKEMYEDYFVHTIRRWRNGRESRNNLVALPDMYKTYRALTGAKPPVPLLRLLFELYFPTDVAGLEEVYRDWHRAWGDLDQWGFEKFLKFYAKAGDINAVKDLWARYVARYPDVLHSPRAFRSTMNVYAQTGDVAAAETEFRLMKEKYGVTPDIDTWNMLLKCYVRADDFTRVIQCFEEIDPALHPDSFTYAHVMTMASKRGDLETTLEFFNRSQKDRVPVSKEMAMALVMAYCFNNRITDAEIICSELAKRKATTTAVWNKLLYHNGVRGNLDKCYELLRAMKTHDIEWDSGTYEFLLEALVRVDQVHPAFHLLQKARKNKLFPVRPEHFTVVMTGALRTGDQALVETIESQMRQAGQPLSFKAHVALVDAAIRRHPRTMRTRKLGREIVQRLRAMLPVTVARGSRDVADEPPTNTPQGLMELRMQTRGIGRAIRLLVELREFATAEELINVYAEVFPKYRGEVAFPPVVAAALMLAYLKDEQFEHVYKMWQQTWASTLARSRRIHGGIYPAHEYDLDWALNVVVKAYREANDGHGLLDCVKQVTGAGFKLTHNNWNLVVQYLAETGQWEHAMEWCEDMLMPRWRGWTTEASDLQTRREFKSRRVLVASKATVLSLQKEWIKLRNVAAWSGRISHKLEQIELRCPRLHHAFLTSDFGNLPGKWTGARVEKSLSSATRELLRIFPYKEANAMKNYLDRELRRVENLLKQRRASRSGASTTASGDDDGDGATAQSSSLSSSPPLPPPGEDVTQTQAARQAELDIDRLNAVISEKTGNLQDAS
ncbi:DNA helicase [Purpureocillium takamizusanense]|uniref:DNA helicase n=1 Tax=Purpureocillium takamizusanense TaxID=2060973 RepID=A0A9Q8V576_9HYPO|nr:DNA helicase [Purpureocillium takamizusanense]UNI13430.1 DNA helicase [Purpureocillium takamizusanense]